MRKISLAVLLLCLMVAGSVFAETAVNIGIKDSHCVSIGDYSGAIGTGAVWSTAFNVPYKHTLTKVILTTNEVAGSITIDVWSDAPGATTGLSALADADSLFDTATEPAIADASADNYFETATFDNGEAANTAGDWYVINVDAAATVTGASVCLEYTRAN